MMVYPQNQSQRATGLSAMNVESAESEDDENDNSDSDDQPAQAGSDKASSNQQIDATCIPVDTLSSQ
jgi:hypothetical protein